MITESPQAHLWLNIPATCRIEGQLITGDELRFVFGDPRADGHTLEFDRGALERFHALAGDLLGAVIPDDPRSDYPELVSVV